MSCCTCTTAKFCQVCLGLNAPVSVASAKAERKVWGEVAEWVKKECEWPSMRLGLTSRLIREEADRRFPRKLKGVATGSGWTYRYANGSLEVIHKDSRGGWDRSRTTPEQLAAVAALANNPYDDD